MTARRTLSPRGRVIAAGLSIGAAGVLAGAMAISDSTADASSSTTTNNAGFSNSDGGGTTATPYTPSPLPSHSQQTPSQQSPSASPQFQPHTRSGGS